MKYTLLKRNMSGFTHSMIIAVVVVLGVAAFGAYKIAFSSAATATEVNASGQRVAAPTQAKCKQLGRVWSQNVCAWSSVRREAPNKFCVSKTAAYVKMTPYDGCPEPAH